MPSTVPGQHNYYAAHHRRQSSQSQSNLPDQISQSAAQVQSPNRSLVFLPSTAYSPSQPASQRARTPSLIPTSRSTPKTETALREEPSNDPHDFYRQYQDPFSNSSPVALHQEAIRTAPLEHTEEPPMTVRKPSFGAEVNRNSSSRPASRKLSLNTQTLPNGIYNGAHARPAQAMPNVLRSRKSSFKDLVARFDASPDDVPPLPIHQLSRPASRTASPMPYMPGDTSHSYQPQAKRASSRAPDPNRRAGSSMGFHGGIPHSRSPSGYDGLTQIASNPEAAPASGRRLLFGEVPSAEDDLPPAPGYGIQHARQRRGSEGSPMHSPNPMFQTKRSNAPLPGPSISSSASRLPSSDSRPAHQRATSDLTGPPPRNVLRGSQAASPVDPTDTTRPGAQSRIPVSTRHQRIASDTPTSSPTGPTTAVPHQQLPFRATDSRQHTSSPSPSGHRKLQTTRKQPRSEIQIKSPNSRARVAPTATGEKSPLLRANIIAPPEKISPPLRSSRPRMPVSSASTAASRAKIAEKFQTSAKQQSDRNRLRRPRPPELSDIDLKARRLKITQALSRSREGPDLKGVPATSRTNSMTPSVDEADETSPVIQEPLLVPAVVVDEAANDESEERAFYTPDGQSPQHDQRAFTQNALKVVEGSSSPTLDEIDSPTLGHDGRAFGTIPYNLNTHLQPHRDAQDPQSAVTDATVATEATMIDAEPQTDTVRLEPPSQSIYSQITALRNQDSASPLSSASQASGENSDHADQMSVNLMLRNTTYLDDDEAEEKGYRHLSPPPPLPSVQYSSPRTNDRNSWTSSIEDAPSSTGLVSASLTEPASRPEPRSEEAESSSRFESDESSIEDEVTSHHARDTYSIVNKVLQQQTEAGVVDQQLVDDIFHRIIQIAPDLADAEQVDEDRVNLLCLQELADYSRRWNESSPAGSTESHHAEDDSSLLDDTADRHSERNGSIVHLAPSALPAKDAPPSSYRSHHRYKSSLDSAEDWADTSPSVGDWMQFAAQSPTDQKQRSGLVHEVFPNEHLGTNATGQDQVVQPEQHASVTKPTASAITGGLPRPPSHSPPPPPISKVAPMDHTSWSAPVGVRPPIPPMPPASRPLTAVSQMSIQSSVEHHTAAASSTTTRPSTDDETPENRRLKKRRHILKELVDTEYTYERDMRVLCDIYKQTAIAAISDEDVKILFGSVDLVQQFSKDFLAYLKQVVKPAYVMEKVGKKDGDRISTVQSSAASIMTSSDLTDVEKDELTRVGTAFEASMADMEKVYTEYIRTRHAANKRLEVLQTSSTVKEWLKECSENSSDITNAWSLDALLVKPIQRITKYPLLLQQLLEATPDTHPDLEFIRRAVVEVTDVNIRINEVKKHTELVDQVLNRRRKESDVRNGLTKAFGRRAEKLRQHVGLNDMYEDQEYAKLKISYDNNIAHLFLVTKDCQGYIEAITKWVHRLCELAAAAESWVDVGHTSYAQAESKLRQLAIVVRGFNSIALPDHNEQVTKRVIQPMEKTAMMLERFKTDGKGLIQKREKRLLDYNQFKNKRDRGEKLDKKSTERLEQWEALNLEAKERMKRLLNTTADLVHGCQASLIQLHLNWLGMCQHKFSSAMEIRLDKLDKTDIVKEWQEDFDFQEATALALSICNGSLLAEAVNMVSFLTPGSTTLTGEDSPRQTSWSGTKRSISTSEEIPPMPMNHYHRNSGGPFSSQSDDRTEWSAPSFANGRVRTGSGASGRPPKTPDDASWALATSLHTVNSAAGSRPGTSPGLVPETPAAAAPRLSLEAPSPSLGDLLTASPVAARHVSQASFYTATPDLSQSQPHIPAPPPANPFSSAMPIPTSPEPRTSSEPARDEPGVLFTAASVYAFNIDRSRQQGGFRYLTYVTGEIFDIIAEHGELWLAINQDDPTREIGWIWNKHFAKLAG